MNLLTVTGLHVRYGAFEAVKGVSFALGKGEILGIVGESGSGKSTVAKTLVGLERPSAGTVSLASGCSLQMIFQDAVGSLNPRLTVRQTLREVVALSNGVGRDALCRVRVGRDALCRVRVGRDALGRVRVGRDALSNGRNSSPMRTQVDEVVRRLLEQVGLSEAVLGQYPREMSGGQCQRVSIARALATRPDILVADEPVSALDVSVQARVLNLLRDLRRETGLAILLVAHDLAVVKNVCDRICVMERGRFVDSGEAEDVFANPTSAYTRRLLAAVPRLEPATSREGRRGEGGVR